MNLAKLMRRFPSEEAAAAWIAAARWPEGPVCPRCGVLDEAYRLRTRLGQYTCAACRHRFSVTSGTAMHRTHLPLRTWILAMYLIATSSKGVSALKLAAWLGVAYETAWHLGHRVRAMMAEGALDAGLLRGLVELDETYVGGRPRKKNNGPRPGKGKISTRGNGKPCVFVAAERGGRVAPMLVASHNSADLGAAATRVVDPGAVLLTDELPAYRRVGLGFAGHERVTHSRDEFARDCDTPGLEGLRVHTNTAESWNSTLKRAILGVFHQVSRKHLHRYVAESAFRWNERMAPLERLALLLRVSAPPLPYRTLVA